MCVYVCVNVCELMINVSNKACWCGTGGEELYTQDAQRKERGFTIVIHELLFGVFVHVHGSMPIGVLLLCVCMQHYDLIPMTL